MTGAPPPWIGSAPDVVGPVSLLNWPVVAAGRRPRGPQRPFRHVRLEIDLAPDPAAPSPNVLLRPLEHALGELPVRERGSLAELARAVLHGFSAAGYQGVTSWKAGRIGSPARPDREAASPPRRVGEVLTDLSGRTDPSLGRARQFSARLRGTGDRRAVVVLRRIHRERRHSLTVDLSGTFQREEVHALVAALHRHLPVRSAVVTRAGRA